MSSDWKEMRALSVTEGRKARRERERLKKEHTALVDVMELVPVNPSPRAEVGEA